GVRRFGYPLRWVPEAPDSTSPSYVPACSVAGPADARLFQGQGGVAADGQQAQACAGAQHRRVAPIIIQSDLGAEASSRFQGFEHPFLRFQAHDLGLSLPDEEEAARRISLVNHDL